MGKGVSKPPDSKGPFLSGFPWLALAHADLGSSGNFHNTCWNCTFYGIDPGSLTCQCLKDKKDTSDYTSIALRKWNAARLLQIVLS